MERRKALVDALLGKEFARAESAQGNTQITDWSPNNIKTVIFGWKYLFVEYHVMNKSTKKHGITSKVMVHTFTDKEIQAWEHKGNIMKILETPRLISAVEEIFLLETSDYPAELYAQDVRNLANFVKDDKVKSRFPRLFAAGCIKDMSIATVKQLLEQGRNKHVHYAYKCKHFQCMYKNPDWWRYGDTGYAPLRPKYYVFDAHPQTETDAVTEGMLLHRCFTEVAKPYYEAESIKNAEKQALCRILKQVTKKNEEYTELIGCLHRIVADAAVNDALYSCNRARARDKNWAMPNLRLKKIASAVRQIYVYKQAGKPKDYVEWIQAHSKADAYAEDTLYDTYVAEYDRNLRKVRKLLDCKEYFDTEVYGVFAELLCLLRYTLYALLAPSTEITPENFAVAQLNAIMHVPEKEQYKQYCAMCAQGAGFHKETHFELTEDVIDFVYDLCSCFCYAVVLAEYECMHLYVNLRFDNPNIIGAQILYDSDLYDVDVTLETPQRYMFYDRFLLQLAERMPYIRVADNAATFKTLREYIPSIGLIKLVPLGEKMPIIHVTSMLTEEVKVPLAKKIFGCQALAKLVQYILCSEGIGFAATGGMKVYETYKGNWHTMPRKEFVSMVERCKAANASIE